MKSNKDQILGIVTFVGYSIIVAFGLYHHELWGDEIHSWNIAKSSRGLVELFSNIRYEGHPPIWYILLWVLSKFTHEAYSIQILHFFIAMLLAWIVLFLSPFSLLQRILILSGYYFLYEYAVLSRNYAVGIVMVFAVMWLQSKELKYKNIFYYALLFLIANTHLLACILAISIHVGYVLSEGSLRIRWLRLVGFCMFLPTLYFIFPPTDSGIELWRHKWELKQMLLFLQVPLKAFVSIPAWWEYHFWESNFLLNYRDYSPWIRQFLIVSSSLIVLVSVFYLVYDHLRARYTFMAIVILTFSVNLLLPMTSMRYAGYFYISFIGLIWLLYTDSNYEVIRLKKIIIMIILVLQLPRGVYALYKDWQFPFSLSSEVVHMSKNIPLHSSIVTTYWSINNLSAFHDKPFYCLETRKEESFIKWDGNLKSFLKEPTPYTERLNGYFKIKKCKEVYLFATLTIEQMNVRDSLLKRHYNFKLIDKRVGAIEPSGDQYLYLITPKVQPL